MIEKIKNKFNDMRGEALLYNRKWIGRRGIQYSFNPVLIVI